MSRATFRAAAVALALATELGASTLARSAEPPVPAPPSIRGTLVLEPSRLELGDVAELEIAVVTPPDFVVREAGPPPETPGFWVLASERQPVVKQPGRWIHRTRLRVRARALGRFDWPAWPLVVESPDGVISPLVIEGREIEVRSVLNEFSGRDGPFGLRRAPGGRGGDPLVPALAGALVTLALLALVALVRRERRRRAAREAEPGAVASPGGAAPWDEAQRELERAAQAADPNAAADAAAAAVRRYLTRRFGITTEPFATEELAAGETPFVVRSRWPRYLALLAELDALRFPPLPGDADARAEAALAEARALVADSTPRPDEPRRTQGPRS